ncbi:ABC transporter ATP-binding protein [Fervidobacterium thailandense]|uniref:Multidrug ABC transporter ATP-binding protein n=1 Tax=Fervidobacterium thailandense TaxID=1008305 RepID=A0A1E3G1A4_9BACT|nr:ABC transporter ATP-binding protein [Fervidobacterium thailandense]ODN30026.1 multidrug ABC transporter ATP-binding protein [Fervidobacterium thailandense]
MVLKVEDLKKYYGEKNKIKAVDGISFEIEKGEIFSLLGPNGAGKTTTIKCILGLRKPTSGSIEFFGQFGIAYVPEGKELYENYSVERMIAVAEELTENFDSELCWKLTEEFDIPLREKIANLSNGEQTLLYLAVTLSQRADLYIFDEPTLGLDPIVRNKVLERIRTIPVDKEGASVLYTSHILSEVEKISDKVAIMCNGKIVEMDLLDNMKEKFCSIVLENTEPPNLPFLVKYRSTTSENVYITYRTDAERLGFECKPASLEMVFEAVIMNQVKNHNKE